MKSSWAVVFFSSFLILALSGKSQLIKESKKLEKRSVLTFPPGSALQINMGISVAGQFERNSAGVVLAFQQNSKLPVESDSFLAPASVVSARKFSVYNYLRDVITSYGFNGTECLRKMVCQIGETPLPGGLLEDVITFVLSPSKHRSLQFDDSELKGKERHHLKLLLESERLGKSGGNCSSAYPHCVKTPLDFVSTFISV